MSQNLCNSEVQQLLQYDQSVLVIVLEREDIHGCWSLESVCV